MFDWIKQAISPIKDLVSEAITDKDKALAINAKIDELENQLASKIIDAKKEVMVAELKQDDKYTKRARPTVVYAGLSFIFLQFVLPYVNYFLSLELPAPTVPGEFWLAWGGAVGVYAFSRSKYEKGK